MKKITLLAVFAMVVFPMVAMAAVSSPSTPGAIEFSLGGYIKMESDWDSTQTNKNLTQPILRDNNTSFHHGRLKMTANSTRFNFTFKGPKVFGAQLSGLIEADFDGSGNGLVASSGNATGRTPTASGPSACVTPCSG